jgi:hypothetical protein
MSSSTSDNTGFASGGVRCKLVAFCFASSSVLVDSFVLLNPPERKARKRQTRPESKPRFITKHFVRTGKRLLLIFLDGRPAAQMQGRYAGVSIDLHRTNREVTNEGFCQTFSTIHAHPAGAHRLTGLH